MSKNPSLNKKTIIVITLLAVLAAAAAFYAAYSWQQKRVDSLTDQVDSLSGQSGDISPSDDSETTPSEGSRSFSYDSEKDVQILIYAPAKDASVSNPVGVVGEVPGNWSFEANFPVQLKNSEGDVIAEAPATVLGDWQTVELVPFSVQLAYSGEESGSGSIVLQKANASGLPEHDDSVTIPVKF